MNYYYKPGSRINLIVNYEKKKFHEMKKAVEKLKREENEREL